MPLSLTKAQEKIQTRIFDTIGSNATIINNTIATVDKWGDPTSTVTASTAVTLVPFNRVSTEEYQPFGNLQAGELDMIVPYDTTVAIGDTIVFGSNNYRVREYETYPYQNGSLAIALRLVKIL